ncbi:MAG TPA: hypothetical protein VE913_21420, partial [Longimicrobium sp.]|nr:hypothetical protein [Longimicrobium sp.]
MQALLLKLQHDIESRKQPRWEIGPVAFSATLGGLLCILAFMLGARSAGGGLAPAAILGATDLQAAELERLREITAYSARYQIPSDLAANI